MIAKKQYLKTRPVCKVTFKLKKNQACGAQKVNIAGDFNQWKGSRTPMRALKSGDFTATVVLPKDREYQYRYVLDDHRWMTDEAADKQVFCDFANDRNAVVVV
jgi:1,4-alpha-glucan branching enzyme